MFFYLVPVGHNNIWLVLWKYIKILLSRVGKTVSSLHIPLPPDHHLNRYQAGSSPSEPYASASILLKLNQMFEKPKITFRLNFLRFLT